MEKISKFWRVMPLLVLAMGIEATSAEAGQISYALLAGMSFDDRGTVSGSFVWDTTTHTISSVDITTTNGGLYSGQHYLYANTNVYPSGFNAQTNTPIVTPNLSVFLPVATSLLTTSTQALVFFYSDGGLDAPLIHNIGRYYEGFCVTSDCYDVRGVFPNGPRQLATLGQVVPFTPTAPEPSSVALFGSGACALLAMARRMRRSPSA